MGKVAAASRRVIVGDQEYHLAQARARVGSGRLGEGQGQVQVELVVQVRGRGTVEAAACWLR